MVWDLRIVRGTLAGSHSQAEKVTVLETFHTAAWEVADPYSAYTLDRYPNADQCTVSEEDLVPSSLILDLGIEGAWKSNTGKPNCRQNPDKRGNYLGGAAMVLERRVWVDRTV